MNKISLLLIFISLIIGTVRADDKTISSPDGKLKVTISVNSGVPTYRINYNGKVFLKPSPIVETTVPFDVVEPRYEASQQYEYTKGSWSWIIKMDGGTVFDVQKQYIDFSSEMGYETILVDALWDTQIGYDRIEELAAYGKSKDVSLYLWYNSNGYWNCFK